MNDHTDARDDELLHRVLDEAAGAVHPTPDWDDVRERAHRRRWWIPTAAAVAVLALVGAALIAFGGGDGDTDVTADDPDGSVPEDPTTTETTEATTPTEPTTSTSATRMEAGPEVEPLALPAGAPLGDDEIVASISVPDNDEPDTVEVVVLSKDNGDVVRTLDDDHTSVEGGVYGLTLTPDRRTVLYVVATSACTSRIDAAPVDGSSDPVVVRDDANQVALSPDGSAMAIATGDLCVSPPSIALVPLEGGRTTLYREIGPEGHAVESMVFADEDTLLHVVGPPVSSDPWPGLYELDLRSGTRTSVVLGPAGSEYRSLGRHAGQVTALEVSDGDGAGDVVIIDGRSIVDRVSVGFTGASTVHAAVLDAAGAVVAVVEFEGDRESQVTIDGRPLRSDVASCAL